MEPIEIKVQPTLNDAILARSAINNRSVLAWLYRVPLAGLGLVTLLIGFRRLGDAPIFGLICIGFGSVLTLATVGGHLNPLRWLRASYPELTYRFTEEGVEYSTTDTRAHMKWAVFSTWFHTQHYFVFFNLFTRTGQMVIPTTCFSSHTQRRALIDLLEKHLGKEKGVTFTRDGRPLWIRTQEKG